MGFPKYEIHITTNTPINYQQSPAYKFFTLIIFFYDKVQKKYTSIHTIPFLLKYNLF